jgi:hypothetical protein
MYTRQISRISSVRFDELEKVDRLVLAARDKGVELPLGLDISFVRVRSRLLDSSGTALEPPLFPVNNMPCLVPL